MRTMSHCHLGDAGVLAAVGAHLRQHLALQATPPISGPNLRVLQHQALASNKAAAGRRLASLARLLYKLPALSVPVRTGTQVGESLKGGGGNLLVTRAH